MLGQFVLQEFCLFLKCPLIQHQALSSRLHWLLDACSKPTPSTAASSLFRVEREREMSHFCLQEDGKHPLPILSSASRSGINSQSRAEGTNLSLRSAWPSQLYFLTLLHLQIGTLAPGTFGDGSSGFHQFAASASMFSRCTLLSVPTLENVCCTEIWGNSNLKLPASPTEESVCTGKCLATFWGDWGTWRAPNFTARFLSGVKFPQVLPWILLHPDSSVQAAHGLCPGLIWHLKLLEVTHT